MATIESTPVADHQATIPGLSGDPRALNTVQIACDSDPTDVTTLTYRALAAPSGNFPRIGSVWIGGYIYSQNPNTAQKIQLYEGASLTPAQTSVLRNANPNVIVLPAVNAMVAVGYPNGVVYGSITLPNGTVTAPITVPDASYYLRDVNGNLISTWPGGYLLNLTNPVVAQFIGQAAYQVLANSNFAYDGIFFDEFHSSISWLTTDVNGNPIHISSANNGVADQQASLDAAWGNGAYTELSTFRSLAPSAYTTGHLGNNPPAGATISVFNGDSLDFEAVDIREGSANFGDLFNNYQTWMTQSRTPPLSMVQSSPPNQIAYGYGFKPIPNSGPSVIPAPTIVFGQTFYPNMRFGLAISLMNNGFSTFDFGDTGAPVNWWYDEYDFNLGTPQGAAQNISGISTIAQLTNNGFENGLTNWQLSVDNSGGDTAAATASSDTTTAAQGSASAHITVTSPTSVQWHISFSQQAVSLVSGTPYTLSFWAKASATRTIGTKLQGTAPAFTSYYTNQINIGTTWQQYTVSFTSGATDAAAQLEFFLGGAVGDVWLDNVQFSNAPPNIFRRDFSNGSVLLNGTNTVQTINVGSGFQRFSGSQAPRYQYIVDDTDTAFSSTGTWTSKTIDSGNGTGASGETVSGPYYHAWNESAQTNSGTGTAQWNLKIPADGTYTIQAWLPAAPSAGSLSKNAVYEVMAGTTILATTTIDQTTAASGDMWHAIATLSLTAGSAPFVRLHSGDEATILADAIYVTSAARFNDGSTASSVTLQPMDAILLQRQQTASPATQIITFAAIANQPTGTTLTLSASASSGLTASFSSSTSAVCTVSGATASFVSTGTCTITASQAGNRSYAAATPVSQSFSVFNSVLNTQTISFPPISFQPVNTTLTLTATASSGLAISYTSSTASACTVTGAIGSFVNAGTCTITASQGGNSAYAAATPVSQSFAVFNSVLTPQTISFPSISMQMANTTLTLTASASSGLAISYTSSTASACTVSGAIGSFVNAGTCTITASQGGNSAYAAATPVSRSFAVFNSVLTPQTISFPSIPIQMANTTLTLTASASSGLPISFSSSATSVCRVSGAVASFLSAGTCIITASQAGNSSYAPATPVSRTFSVFNPQTISFAAIPTQTANTTLTLGASASSGLPVSYSSSTTAVCTVSANTASLVGVGSCTMVAAQSGNATYTAASPVSQTFSVTASKSTNALQFVPVAPCRVADTRLADGPFGGPVLASNTTRDFLIPSSPCGIPSNAAAYSLNVTAVPVDGLAFLALWPSGSSQPLVSTLNSDGRVKANAAIVPAGANGGVSVYVSDASHVVLDINGYFVSGNSAALDFYPVTPCRIADTRLAISSFGGPSLTAGVTRTFPVQSSSCGIPASAQAYALNFTAVPHSSISYLSTWPAGQVRPLVSTLNSGGQITSNAAIVPSGANGAVSVYSTNDTDIVIDVNGYFAPPGAAGLSLYNVTPCRVIDTRTGSGAFKGVLNVAVSPSACLSAPTAKAFVLNSTVVPTQGLSYITVWPNGLTQPYVSTLNANDGAITSNMAIVPSSNGTVSVFATDSTQLILDISAYFAP